MRSCPSRVRGVADDTPRSERRNSHEVSQHLCNGRPEVGVRVSLSSSPYNSSGTVCGAVVCARGIRDCCGIRIHYRRHQCRRRNAVRTFHCLARKGRGCCQRHGREPEFHCVDERSDGCAGCACRGLATGLAPRTRTPCILVARAHHGFSERRLRSSQLLEHAKKEIRAADARSVGGSIVLCRSADRRRAGRSLLGRGHHCCASVLVPRMVAISPLRTSVLPCGVAICASPLRTITIVSPSGRTSTRNTPS